MTRGKRIVVAAGVSTAALYAANYFTFLPGVTQGAPHGGPPFPLAIPGGWITVAVVIGGSVYLAAKMKG